MADVSQMEMAMEGMARAVRHMKGNAPSHDYSSQDGEYELSMDDDEDDSMEEWAESDDEYVDQLEEELEFTKAKLSETRALLRTVGEHYVVSLLIHGLTEDQAAGFVRIVVGVDLAAFQAGIDSAHPAMVRQVLAANSLPARGVAAAGGPVRRRTLLTSWLTACRMFTSHKDEVSLEIAVSLGDWLVPC